MTGCVACCIAKKQNIPKAYQAIMESINVRHAMSDASKNLNYSPIPIRGFEFTEHDNDIEHIEYSPFLDIRKHISWSFHKCSKSYAPLFILRAGFSELNQLQKLVPIDKSYEIMVCMYDYMDTKIIPTLQKTHGKKDFTVTLIVDYSGMERRRSGIQSLWYLKSLYTFHERHFPNRFEKIFITNASGAFLTFWRWVRPWMSSATLDRLHVLEPSETCALHEFVAIENLPSFLKGTCNTCLLPSGCVPVPLSS